MTFLRRARGQSSSPFFFSPNRPESLTNRHANADKRTPGSKRPMPPAFSGTARAVRCMDAEISGRYRNGSRRTASIRSRKQVALSNRLRSCLVQQGPESGELLIQGRSCSATVLRAIPAVSSRQQGVVPRWGTSAEWLAVRSSKHRSLQGVSRIGSFPSGSWADNLTPATHLRCMAP